MKEQLDSELEEQIKVEQFPRIEGRLMVMIVAPK